MTDEQNRDHKHLPPPEANSGWSAIKALVEGFATTLKHLARKPITEQYPEYKRELPERSRARIVLTRDPDGAERCVACYLCSAVCPVSCISMQSDENEEGRRYARWFRINFGRCIYCGLCEEACPTSAIQLTPDFENIQRDIVDMVFEKENLLINDCGKDKNYNFYKYAGVETEDGKKGSHEKESKPVNVRSNMP